MVRGKVLGKSIVLIILIIILVFFGLMWFDYLGVVRAKKIFAPVYKLIGLQPQTTETVSSPDDLAEDDLDNRGSKHPWTFLGFLEMTLH